MIRSALRRWRRREPYLLDIELIYLMIAGVLIFAAIGFVAFVLAIIDVWAR